jgi:hypothetical protein
MILKKGTRGKEVKQLQEYLEIGADGVFGPGTEAAVKKWQKENSLVTDGIVGPKTWEAMGLATTDESEQVYTTDNGLIVNRHFLPKGEYLNGPSKKEYCFLHHTAGWNNPYKTVRNWGNDTRGRIATEFVLGGQKLTNGNNDYDGVMVQCMPEGAYGWHLGKNGSQYMHKHSVGIEVNNFGYLKNGKAYQGSTAHESQIVELAESFRGYKQWHRYSDAQIEALDKWIRWIGERDGIDIRAGLPALVKEKGAAAFEWNADAYYGKVKGLWTHTNTRKDKTDMFPQQELLDLLTSL